MKILMFGAPGTGKGTQAKLLHEEFGWTHIAMGDILRIHVKEKTDLGLEASGYMSKGLLVPDELLAKVIEDVVKNKEDFILDGYPRTLVQADHIVNISDVDVVLYLYADDATLIKRLLKRGRNDDTKKTITNRLEIYRKQTFPVLKDLKDRKLDVAEVNSGYGSIDENYKVVKLVLGKGHG